MPRFETTRHDITYALRGFRREPGVALIAIIILALGIGANTAVFSIVNPLLLKPLPLAGAGRLVWIANIGTSLGMSGSTFRVDWYDEFRKHNRSFEDLAAYFAFFGYGSYTMTGRGDPERLVAVDVGPRFFELLGVQPGRGRLFAESDHRHSANAAAGALTGPRAALLTHGFWQRRFGGDPGVVGSAITVNNRSITIAGVMPETFDFSSIFTPGTNVDMFVPADLDQMRPWGNTLSIVGRLREGVTLEQARAEFATLLPQLMEAHKDWGPIAANLTPLKEHVSGRMTTALIVLWSAVGAVLLIVCANLANLLLARASSRGREFAVRLALGADRSRLVRQLLTEGVLLALVGGALGIPLAFALTAWLASSNSLSVPLLHYVRVDTSALLITAAIACVTGVLFATGPALKASAQAPQSALQEQSRGTIDSKRQAWFRKGLVVAEIAIAAVLLIASGLLIRSLARLLDVQLGFDPSRAVAARVDFPATATPEQLAALSRDLVARVSSLPGVEAAGLTDALPLERNRTWPLAVPGKIYGPGERPIVFVYVVGPGYLRAMGIRSIAGRDFLDHDPMQDRQPVIVNETLARALYPDVDPVGRPAVTYNQSLTIVGVVANVRQNSLDEAPVHQMYLDIARGGAINPELVVRTTMDPASLAPALRATLGTLDSRLVATDVRVLTTLVDRATSPRRFFVALLGGFSALALLLASLGIYGVVSYAVKQRTAEFGVRMALGATGGQVRRQVMKDTLGLTLAGVAIGVATSLALARVLGSLLYATSTTDAATFTGAALLLGAVALAAGYLPALRASRIEPLQALRG